MKRIHLHLATLLTGLLLGIASHTSAAGIQISGSLSGFDVRYPNSLPNDFEIYVYGAGLTVADVLSTYPNSQWGTAQSITASVNSDPASPAFGLDCLTVRWVGPPLPAFVEQMLQFGVRLRIGAAVAHSEVWWTINGVRVVRPTDPQVTWIGSATNWLIRVTNPSSNTIYVYGPRWFPVATPTPLSLLSQLNTNINPAVFGAAGWTSLSLPGGGRLFAIPAWGSIHFKVPVAQRRPIVFQMAVRDVDESVLPMSPPTGSVTPNPNDFNGTNGTMSILTTRPTEEFAEDVNGDGSVGTPDFNALRAKFGTTSADISGN